tara:strand:- start:500 stop:718 length:219 start_codon:yes stop_codon:yes gene_type:complete
MKEIDLHGFTHIEAVDRAEDFVLMESHDTIFQCRIITGKSDTLSKKVIKMLESHEFNWYIPTWNIGEIIVTH